MKIFQIMLKTGKIPYFHTFNICESARPSMPKILFVKGCPMKLGAIFLFLVTFLMAAAPAVHGQFWAETFGADGALCETQGANANGFATVNGTWSVEDPSANGFFSNRWYISAAEGGFAPGFCSANCPFDNVFERTLHVGASAEDNGAFYVEEPSPGFYVTDKRAISPVIDCSGQFNIELELHYIHTSSAADFCTVEYFDGTAWSFLADLPDSPGFCAPERTWDDFTVALPASSNSNPDVRIGFRWRNNNDQILNGGGAGHSAAIGFVALNAGAPPESPVADFTIDDPDTFCEMGLIQFFGDAVVDGTFSTGVSGWEWTFEGGTPPTSTVQNPIVQYQTPGVYDVTLTVTDNVDESEPFTQTDFITVLECGPDIAISASQNVICANEECVDFTDLSTGDDISSWTWTFTSPSGDETVSNEQNPTNQCFSEIGFYDVTLEAVDSEGTSIQTFVNYIEVLDCTGPEVDFESSRQVICPGECIELTDLSTSPLTIFAWNWDLPGGQAEGEAVAGSSTQQNPTVCYDTPGTYNITLAAEDQEGVSAITKTIQITVDPCTGPPVVGINASQTDICTGDCVDFTSESLGLIDEYLWVFQGVADVNSSVSTEQNPSVICYSTPGTYSVTLTASNSFGQIDSEVFTNYITVSQCINPPVPRIELNTDTVCAGKCVTFSNVSTGLGIDSVAWNFQGGSPTSSTENNPTVCYNLPGTYSVSLNVSGAGGDSLRAFNNVVTVVNDASCRPQIAIAGPDTICAGDCAPFTGNITDATSVNWTFTGGNPETSTAVSPGVICFPEEGNYAIIVEASNASGAATPLVQNIFVAPNPGLNAGPNQTVNAGTLVTLSATIAGNPNPSGQFEWNPFELVDNFRNPEVITRPRETITYIVSYKEQGGCRTTDTVTVFVNFNEAVGVPSAFSPNDDGRNDQLRVLGQGITQMNFKVFNRYGQLVFETTEQSQGWDGTQNGRPLNPGNFVWVLEVRFAEGSQERLTGDVTLVR